MNGPKPRLLDWHHGFKINIRYKKTSRCKTLEWLHVFIYKNYRHESCRHDVMTDIDLHKLLLSQYHTLTKSSTTPPHKGSVLEHLLIQQLLFQAIKYCSFW